MSAISNRIKHDYMSKSFAHGAGYFLDEDDATRDAVSFHVAQVMKSESEIDRVLFDCADFSGVESKLSDIELLDNDEASKLSQHDIELLQELTVDTAISEAINRRYQDIDDEATEMLIEHGIINRADFDMGLI